MASGDLNFRRRGFLGAPEMGMPTAVMGTVREAPTAQAEAAAAPFEDPAVKYPKPPYPEQHQPWPGLACKMQPRPDHGETSYKGSGRLSGRKALITGGDSGVGRAAAIAFAREGADVVINYLPDEQPDADEVVALIRAEGCNGIGIAGDLRQEAFCQSSWPMPSESWVDSISW
jgi:hypothetical protein